MHMNDSISLHLSTVLNRKEDCSNDITSKLEVQIYKCVVCNHESETEAAFDGHKSLQHNPSIPHRAAGLLHTSARSTHIHILQGM